MHSSFSFTPRCLPCGRGGNYSERCRHACSCSATPSHRSRGMWQSNVVVVVGGGGCASRPQGPAVGRTSATSFDLGGRPHAPPRARPGAVPPQPEASRYGSGGGPPRSSGGSCCPATSRIAVPLRSAASILSRSGWLQTVHCRAISPPSSPVERAHSHWGIMPPCCPYS